jgi:isopenicillin-N epimerase
VKDSFLLDPAVVYLNHGSFGACPRPVFEAYQQWQRELERQPVAFLALERGLPARLDEARRALSAFVGAAPGNLAFMPNATTGLNAVVRSLELGPGDEVLLGDAEYGGMERLWEFVRRRTGAAVARRPFDELDPGPQTRVVFCSHIEWSTGRVNDLAPLVARTRASGALLVVDGAHAPGQIDLRLDELGADVYAGNCHKWLCAPKGAGFLHVRRELQETIAPLVAGWGYRDESTFLSRHEEQGTRDPSAFLTVPDAIEWQQARNWDAVRERCRALASEAPARLGLEPLGTDLQMVSMRLPSDTPAGLQERLYDEHRIEIPVFDGLIRASFQGYNGRDDLEALRTALERLL